MKVRSAILATVMAASLAAPAPARTADAIPATASDTLTLAANRATARIKALHQEGTPPVAALARPDTAAMLDAAFDLDAIRTLPAAFESVHTACTAMGETYSALFEYARGTDQKAGLAAIHDLFSAASRAVELCKKRSLIALGVLIDTMPPGMRGDAMIGPVRGVQANLYEFTSGILLLVTASEFSANRASLIAGLAEDADRVSALFAPTMRKAMRERLMAAAVTLEGRERAALELLARSYGDGACTTTLCRIANGVG